MPNWFWGLVIIYGFFHLVLGTAAAVFASDMKLSNEKQIAAFLFWPLILLMLLLRFIGMALKGLWELMKEIW